MPHTGADEVNPAGVQTSTVTAHPVTSGQVGAAPTAAAGAALGSSPPACVVVAGTTDYRGTITFGSGTSPTTGVAVTVTFAAPYVTSPGDVNISETTVATSVLSPAVTSITKTSFVVSLAVAPTASQANTVYGFDYEVVA